MKQKAGFQEYFKYFGMLIGMILIFISIWMNGWYILRFALTGLILIIWCLNITDRTEVKK